MLCLIFLSAQKIKQTKEKNFLILTGSYVPVFLLLSEATLLLPASVLQAKLAGCFLCSVYTSGINLL